MDKELLKFLGSALRHRMLVIGILCAISYVLCVFVIRSSQPTYTATLDVFTRSPEGTVRPYFSSYSHFKLMSLIARQEHLLKTTPILSRIASVYSEKDSAEAKAEAIGEESIRAYLSRAAQYLFFGSDYLSKKSKTVGSEFDRFKGVVTLRRSKVDSTKFSLISRSKDPVIAAKVVKATAEALIELNIEVSSKNSSAVASYLERMLKESESRLKDSSRSIASFIKKHQIPSRPELIESKYSQLYQTRKDVTQAEQKVVQKRLLLDQSFEYVRRLKEQAERILVANNDVRIEVLLGEIKQLEYNLVRQRQQGNSGGNIKSIRRQLTKLRTQLSKELNGALRLSDAKNLKELLSEAQRKVELYAVELKAAKAQLKSFRKLTGKFEKEVRKLPDLEAELSKMTLENKQLRVVHEMFLKNYLNVISNQGSAYSKLFLVDEPHVDRGVLASGKFTLLLKAIVVSTFFVILLVCAFDFYQQTIYTTESLGRLENSYFLGPIANIPSFQTLNLNRFFQGKASIARLAHTLGTELERAGFHDGKVVLVTSASEKSGKSLSTLALGNGLAKTGASVLILDSDVRAAGRDVSTYYIQHPKFGRKPEVINDLLVDFEKINLQGEKGKVQVAILSTEKDLGVFSEQIKNRFNSVLSNLSNRFDFVLIDAAPIVFFEVLALSKYVDSSIVCVPEGRVTLEAVSQVIDELQRHKREDAVIFTLLTDSKVRSNVKGVYAYQGYSIYQGRRQKVS